MSEYRHSRIAGYPSVYCQQDVTRDAGMDWMQVRLNGGPPCFNEELDGTLCGRAKCWAGHPEIHAYVSLESHNAAVRVGGAEDVAKLVEAAEKLLNSRTCTTSYKEYKAVEKMCAALAPWRMR